jgi:hypothetical protein
MYGNDTAEVTTSLEYTLGGGWSTYEQYTWTQSAPQCPSPPNGGITCADHLATIPLNSNQSTGAIRVRVSMEVRIKHCDNCTLRVSNVSAGFSVRDIRVIASGCHIPAGETTLPIGWNSVHPTAHDWRQTLIPPSGVNFGGRTVTEEDPGGGGPDTCHFGGSSVPYQDSISGGAWIVGADNGWGYDTVGWTASGVEYYRQQGRAPCQTSFPQRMVIACGGNKVPYITNLLVMGFDAVNVWSERAGVRVERIWP